MIFQNLSFDLFLQIDIENLRQAKKVYSNIGQLFADGIFFSIVGTAGFGNLFVNQTKLFVNIGGIETLFNFIGVDLFLEFFETDHTANYSQDYPQNTPPFGGVFLKVKL